ncbi:MAG: FlgO family outer membrane protein [Thalassotalea sp.]|nr:FlgO family outer membrane protein [Thalassotalea sp.]
MILLKELRRRNVFKVASVYLITAWIILQIISVVSPYLHLPRVFGTIVTVILVIGFPIAAIFAWAFELTPEGLKRTHEVEADESIGHETGLKINNLLIGAIVVLVSFIAYDKLYKPNNRSQNSLSIAVLPFEDMSPDNSQEHFGDGIAEEILNSLAQIKHLSVIARTSSFSFKEQKISVKDIAQKLNVDFVLEGSVRKHGDKLRITAQLIDTKKDITYGLTPTINYFVMFLLFKMK